MKRQADAQQQLDAYIRQAAASSPADELVKLAGLRDQGSISDSEFEQAKQKLLSDNGRSDEGDRLLGLKATTGPRSPAPIASNRHGLGWLMAKWGVLTVLGAAQFLMVLDQAVMNVAISQLVADFDTTVTTIQAVIALYALVMAGLMLTGGKIGDLIGRRRAFAIGLVIYGAGSALTAASWSVPILTLGWSVLEGIGAALVLPAMVALVASNFQGQDRALAYGVLGGVAGAGIAVGPILGGWATTELSWRVVFVGEVVVAIGILAGIRLIKEPPRTGAKSTLDWFGGCLSALGLGLLVFGFIQASNWGWLVPRSSPLKPFGFSLTPFVIAAGGLVLAAFSGWERRRENRGEDPLVHLQLLRLPRLRGGVVMLLAQNLVLMGVFFTVPLFLQVVQGLDALETGVRMLPASVGLFTSALAGSALAKRFPARLLVRTGLAIVFVAVLLLLDTIEPELDNASFLIAMGVLGVGMGLIISQLGNVVQSAVGDEDRSEAGGLQYTAQQLGSSLGTAVLGAIVITGLLSSFSANVADNPRIAADTKQQVQVRLSAGGSFVAAEEVRTAATSAGLDPDTVDQVASDYEDAQLKALKTAFLAAALLVLASFFAARKLPTKRFDELQPAAET
jgi:MFS family permease